MFRLSLSHFHFHIVSGWHDDDGGVESKVTCHRLSQFTSPQIDEQVRIPQWEVFSCKKSSRCCSTETETLVSKILSDQFTFDWNNVGKCLGQKDYLTTHFKTIFKKRL